MDEFYFVSTKACQEQGYPRMGQALIAILCRPRDVHGPWVESGQPSRLRSTLVFDASLHQTLQGGGLSAEHGDSPRHARRQRCIHTRERQADRHDHNPRVGEIPVRCSA